MPFCNIELKAEKPLSPDYPLELKTLGDHLRKKRLDLRLFQREVAQIIEVGELTILAWEKNKAEPEFQYIPRIIAFLGYLPFSDILDKPLDEKLLLLQHLYGISQEALARKLGVDPSTVSKWVRGKGWPKTEMINELLLACTGSSMPQSLLSRKATGLRARSRT